MTESETISTSTYCYAHPARETSLRCKRCERYMCASCSVRTPTGYVCRECVKAHQKSFDTAEWYDYGLGFITAGLISSVAAFLVTLIGGIGIFGWFLIAAGAPIAATAIAESVRFVTRRHRSRPLFVTVAVGVVAGALPIALIQLLTLNLFGIIFQAIYLVIAVPLVYTRLSGIQLFR
jgi:hypothetical protein